MKLIPSLAANTRIDKARKASYKGIKYRMGHGGTDPDDDLPTKDNYCDCSGFAAWTMGLNRAPKKDRPFWIETTAIVRDALGLRKAFTRLLNPEPGCYAVYGDTAFRQGHILLVTEVSKDGRLTCIDCSSGSGGKKKESIREWDRTSLIYDKKAIFVTLRQDIKHLGGQLP